MIKHLILSLFFFVQFVYASAQTSKDPSPVDSVKEYQDEEFAVVEQMPEFPGGQKKMLEFISQNLQYPTESRKLGEQGVVYVGFVVDKAGAITKIRIVKGVSKFLDAEGKRVVATMPKWKPGYQEGRPVRVQYIIPLKFTLTDAPENKK